MTELFLNTRCYSDNLTTVQFSISVYEGIAFQVLLLCYNANLLSVCVDMMQIGMASELSA